MPSQRETMREIFQNSRGDKERAIRAYAEAERSGRVIRRSNDYDVKPETYARALIADGKRKGWLE